MVASVYRLADASGALTERIPPADWSPSTATPEELTYFGIPAKPAADSSDLPAWQDEWINHYKGFGLAISCAPLTADSANVTSYNWSGIVTRTPGTLEAYGTTTYNLGTTCASNLQPDSYTNWVGIGGANGSSRLIQNGFWTAHTQGSWPFHEAISGTDDTHVVAVTLSGDPSNGQGHQFNIATIYDPGAGQDQIRFYWHDLTTGVDYSQQYTSFDVQSGNHSAAYFYDGNGGEAIDERGTINKVFSSLRDFGDDYWFNAQVSINGTFHNMRAVMHDGDTMKNASTGSKYADAFGEAAEDQFYDHWYRCGPLGN